MTPEMLKRWCIKSRLHSLDSGKTNMLRMIGRKS